MLPKLVPCDLQCYLDTANHMPLALDLFIMVLKEPWAVRQFMKALGTTQLASEARPLARRIARAAAGMCKNLPPKIHDLDPRVGLERASITRQYGLMNMGFLVTLKRFAILTKEQKPAKCARNGKSRPTQHKRASKSEQFEFLGKMYVVQQNPRELQEFVEIEGAMSE